MTEISNKGDTMKKILSAILSAGLALASAPGMAMEYGAEEELFFFDLPMVVTAAKQAQTLEDATSVISVITSEEIQRSGARNLHEVLEFFGQGFLQFYHGSALGDDFAYERETDLPVRHHRDFTG